MLDHVLKLGAIRCMGSTVEGVLLPPTIQRSIAAKLCVGPLNVFWGPTRSRRARGPVSP